MKIGPFLNTGVALTIALLIPMVITLFWKNDATTLVSVRTEQLSFVVGKTDAIWPLQAATLEPHALPSSSAIHGIALETGNKCFVAFGAPSVVVVHCVDGESRARLMDAHENLVQTAPQEFTLRFIADGGTPTLRVLAKTVSLGSNYSLRDGRLSVIAAPLCCGFAPMAAKSIDLHPFDSIDFEGGDSALIFRGDKDGITASVRTALSSAVIGGFGGSGFQVRLTWFDRLAFDPLVQTIYACLAFAWSVGQAFNARRS